MYKYVLIDLTTMSKFLKKHLLPILLILIVLATVSGVFIYKSRNTKLLDRDAYAEIKTALEVVRDSDEGGFADAADDLYVILNSLSPWEGRADVLPPGWTPSEEKPSGSGRFICCATHFSTL